MKDGFQNTHHQSSPSEAHCLCACPAPPERRQRAAKTPFLTCKATTDFENPKQGPAQGSELTNSSATLPGRAALQTARSPVIYLVRFSAIAMVTTSGTELSPQIMAWLSCLCPCRSEGEGQHRVGCAPAHLLAPLPAGRRPGGHRPARSRAWVPQPATLHAPKPRGCV